MSEQCCTKYSLRLKVFILQGSSLNREVNNSKQLQHVPETDQIHYATPCKSKQNGGGGWLRDPLRRAELSCKDNSETS